MDMRVTAIRPGFVAEIGGIDLARPMTAATMAALWEASDAHAILVFRGQMLTDAQQITFTGAGTQDGADSFIMGNESLNATGTWYFDWSAGRSDGEFSPAQWDPLN